MQFNYRLIIEFNHEKIIYFNLYSIDKKIVYHGFNVIKKLKFKSLTFLNSINEQIKNNKDLIIIPIDDIKFNELSNLSFKKYICNFNKKQLFKKLDLEEYII